MSPAATPHRVVTLAGHVDHGKSTLVAALTGMPTDRLTEERRRGLTIELGFTWFDLPPTAEQPGPATLALVDVPGHERFLATMVAGAGCASAALLVCAADEGPSVQTVEHLEVLRLLELPLLAVVITKADRVDAARLAACRDEVTALLGADGDAALAATPVVPVDARDDTTLAPLRRVLRTRLAALPPVPDGRRGRLWIDRVFSVEGSGTVVTGTLGDGVLHAGGTVRLLPSGRDVRVRRLESLGRSVDPALAGTRVAVNLGSTGRDGVRRGDAVEVASDGAPRGTLASTAIDAAVWTAGIDVSRTDVRDVLAGARRLHVGTAAVPCRIRPVAPDAADAADGRLAVRIRLERPLVLRSGDRLLLTGTGDRRVVAGGVVCDPLPSSPRGRAARAAHAHAVTAVAAALREHRDDDVVRALVALGGGIRSHDELAHALGTTALRLPEPEGTVRIGEALALEERLAGLPDALERFGAHVVGTDELAAALLRVGHARAHVDALVEHLVAIGRLRRTTLGLVVEQHADAALDAREARYAAVVARIESEPFQPPDFRTVADEVGLDHRERVQLLASDLLVRCDDVVVGRRAFERAVGLLRELDAEQGGRGFTAAQARDTLGSTRRVTVPLLEEMARRRLSRFDGERHRIGAVDAHRSASTTNR